jgi:hypothetical protein
MVPVPPRRPPVGRLPVSCLVVVGALALLGACGGSGSDSGTPADDSVPEATPVPTVGGVGNLPDPVDPTRAPIMVRPRVDDEGNTAEVIGEQVAGNRILLIGDSILASTSSRYGRQMCDVLVPLGWAAQIEAEPSRFIDFGNLVLRRVLPDGITPANDFDAAGVFLGSNYGGDPVRYEAELREILDRLAPRPTLLFTVTQYRPDYAEVNEVVRRLADEYENVTLIDWELASQTPGVLSGDRLHPTDEGRLLIANLVATELGASSIGEGDCLSSQFRDDSNITGDRGTVLGGNRGSSGSSGSSGNRTTTTTATTLPQTTAPTAPPATTAPTTPVTTQPVTVPSVTATTMPPPTIPADPGDGLTPPGTTP